MIVPTRAPCSHTGAERLRAITAFREGDDNVRTELAERTDSSIEQDDGEAGLHPGQVAPVDADALRELMLGQARGQSGLPHCATEVLTGANRECASHADLL